MQARSASNVKVIDVSHFQGTVDWKKVHGDGVLGTYIKATEGTNFTDPALATFAANAPAAGLRVGFYHYAHPELNDAVSEASYFVSAIARYKGDFPHVLDVEGDAAKLSAAKLTDWCVQWLQEVKRQTGHDTMIYSGASFDQSYLGAPLRQWPLWIANYGTNKPLDDTTWSSWSVFQYTATGSINGISGNVDINAMEMSFYNRYSNAAPVLPLSPQDTIKVVVNDKLAAYGRNRNGTVYAPLRQLGDSIGAIVTWDPSTRTPSINGTAVTSFTLLGGTAYASVRAIGNFLGGKVSWDSVNQKVNIYI